MNKIKSLIAIFAVVLLCATSMVSCKDNDEDRVLNDQLASTKWKYNNTACNLYLTFNADKTGVAEGDFISTTYNDIIDADGNVTTDTIKTPVRIVQDFTWEGYDGANSINYCEIKSKKTGSVVLLGNGVYQYTLGTLNGQNAMTFGGNTYIKQN